MPQPVTPPCSTDPQAAPPPGPDSTRRPPGLTVYTRAGCHLCHDGVALVRRTAAAYGCTVQVVDVDSNPQLRERFGQLVPVVAVGEQVIAAGRISELRLRQYLSGQGLSPRFLAFLASLLSRALERSPR